MRGLSNSGPLTADTAAGLRRASIMHPMFVRLFIETNDDDLVAEEEARRRAARRSARARPAMAVRAIPRDRNCQPLQ